MIRRMVALVGVLLIAYGLRVWLLADTNFNWDEGYSVWISALPLPQLFDTTARDVHPPLYYLLLRMCAAVFGDGEFALRYGSVLVGVLTVAVAYRFGRAVGGDTAGLITALLLALARSNIHISQLARMHSLAVFFSVLALWAALRVWDNPRDRRAAVGYVLATAGALYTFYLAIMTPLAVNVAFLWVWMRRGFTRGLLVRWVVLNLAAAVLFMPWALYANERMFGWSSSSATPPLFFTGFYLSTLTVGRPTFDPTHLIFVAFYLAAILAGAAALVVFRHRWAAPTDRAALLLAGIVTPAVVVFLLSLPFHNLGRPLAARYMLPLAVTLYALAGWGGVALLRWRRAGGLAALAVMVVVAGWGLSNIADMAVRRDDMHSIALTLEAMRREGDAVILHNDNTWTSLAAHYDGDFRRIPQAETITERYTEELLNQIPVNYQGVWLITTPAAARNDPTGRIRRWLYDRSMLPLTWTFNEHQLSFYNYGENRAATRNDLAPNAPIPTQYANPDLGLVGVQRPFNRYPVGDRVSLALYWDTPPTAPFTLEFVPINGGDPITHTLPPPEPATTGITRQQLTPPLAADTPTGRYQLWLQVNDTRHHLGAFDVVTLRATDAQTTPAIETRLNIPYQQFSAGDGATRLTLLGYTLPETTVRSGRDLSVTLFWQAEMPLTERYKVSVFLLGEDVNPQTGSRLYAQLDFEPVNWTLPTTLWRVGELVVDPVQLSIPSETPAGTYQLGVVLYNPTTGERLTTPDSDMLMLERVTVR